ncbi:hypothetical protein [Candidatus Tisiphia endosymbiont of Nemotelus uliginosus]|uniref:hypothetical protein n=1 Tax=Candidatus Tisiphia endosymbiont of Nemotelus uliginosus TaxID=3077926 RepID=UPI0035C8F9D8
MIPVTEIDISKYEGAIKSLKDLPESGSWELPYISPEVCFEELYNFLKNCESKGFDIVPHRFYRRVKIIN